MVIATQAVPAAPPRGPRTRQERGLRTQEAILDAALRLVAARGIDETSLDLVASDVGVAKSSILWHFGSKEELLLRVAERALEMIEHGPVREILALPTIGERGAALWQMYTTTIQHFAEVRRVLLYLILACERRPELRERLQQLLRSMRTMLGAGLADVVPDAQRRDQLATLALAALDGLFLQWLIDPAALDLDGLHQQIRRLTAAATTPNGKAAAPAFVKATKPRRSGVPWNNKKTRSI